MFFMLYYIGFIAWSLIVIGVLALLTNLGYISSSIWMWWPILLVVFGVYTLILKKKRKKIAIHGIFQRLANDERIQSKLSKIVDTVDEVVEKKIDEWHKEVSEKKDENIGGEQ
ncbi:MAG: DUF5668 domain-containing protein [bacterium]|nr:DUF5668 domain-containing protein [bacterium]